MRRKKTINGKYNNLIGQRDSKRLKRGRLMKKKPVFLIVKQVIHQKVHSHVYNY